MKELKSNAVDPCSSRGTEMKNVWDIEEHWNQEPVLSQNMKYAYTGILTYFDYSLSFIFKQGNANIAAKSKAYIFARLLLTSL